MNTKSVFTTFAGFVTLMLSGLFLYEVLLKSYFSKLMESMGDCFLKEPPILPIVIAHLCFAVILWIILSRNNVTTFLGGIKNSLVVILLVMVWYESWMFTFIPQLTIQAGFIDVCVNSACSLLAAGVMGWLMGQFKS